MGKANDEWDIEDKILGPFEMSYLEQDEKKNIKYEIQVVFEKIGNTLRVIGVVIFNKSGNDGALPLVLKNHTSLSQS